MRADEGVPVAQVAGVREVGLASRLPDSHTPGVTASITPNPATPSQTVDVDGAGFNPKPYYSDDLVTIYHGDCREWMPEADLLVTDPPYGIAVETDRTKTFGLWRSRREWMPVHGDDGPFDPSAFLSFGRIVLWGGNNFAPSLPIGGWLVWDKVNAPPLGSPCEMAWTNVTRRIFLYREPRPSTDAGAVLHPTQKPVALMRWSIDRVGGTGTILDPFMGSGTTLVAAKSLGRKAIGIEIEERYCEIAARRCSQEVLGLHA